MAEAFYPPLIVRADLEVDSPQRVVMQLAQALAARLALPGGIVAEIQTHRQAGVGHGVALPHARAPGLSQPAAAFARLHAPLDFHAADGRNCDLVYLLLWPEGSEPLKALARAARFFREDGVRAALRAAPSEAALRAVFPTPAQANAA